MVMIGFCNDGIGVIDMTAACGNDPIWMRIRKHTRGVEYNFLGLVSVHADFSHNLRCITGKTVVRVLSIFLRFWNIYSAVAARQDERIQPIFTFPDREHHMPDDHSDSIVFEPLSEAFAQNPYPTYTALRDLNGPYYYEDVDTWMLTKFADVEAVAMDPTMLRSLNDMMSEQERQDQKRKMNWHDMPHHERFVQFSMLDSEGAVHNRLRKLVFREFTPASMNKHRQSIQTIVDKLLDALIEVPEIDFVEDFASHVPGHVIGYVLGVPEADRPQLRIWSENIVQFWNIGRTEDDKRLAESATTEFYHYMQALLAERQKAPKDDLLTRLLAEKNAGNMSEDELVSTSMLILKAGHGSTIDVLCSGMHTLLKYPEQLRRLHESPSLLKTGIQEMFRFESPLPYFHRFSTQESVVAGRSFKSGTRFGLLYGAANRDPDKFENPDTFDVGRSPNRHIAFGGGTHFCLGNHLARLDMDVIFSSLNERFRSITLLDEAPVYKRGLSVRGPETLRIAWSAA